MEVISADPSSLCVYLFHHSNIPMRRLADWAPVWVREADNISDVQTHWVPPKARPPDAWGVSRRTDEKAPAVKPHAKILSLCRRRYGSAGSGPTGGSRREPLALFQPFFCNRIDFFLKFKKH